MIISTIALESGLNARFDEQYRAMQERPHLADIMALATEITSSKFEERYPWFGDVAAVREWIGDKALAGLRDYDYTIRNRDWYSGFSIDRNELEDDQLGGILPLIDMLAMSAAKFPAELIIELLAEGDSRLAYDGAAFFSNRAAPNDNLLAGTGTTLATVKSDIQTARAAMQRFTSDRGKVMGLNGDTIVCAPELEAIMIEAVTAPSIITNGEGTTVNPISRWIKRVISSPELSDANDWYLLATEFPLRPFIFQTRKAPVSVLDDTQEKRNRKLEYSVEMRGNAGYGFFQMACKVVNGS